MQFKQYPSYKPSGVEWLGDVPEHWQQKPIWSLFKRIKRTNFPTERLLSVYRDYGVIPKDSRDDNHNRASEDLTPYQLVCANDLVINKMKAWQGSIAISELRGIVSPAYYIYQPKAEYHSKYIHFLIRSAYYIQSYKNYSKGIRVNQWDLESEAFTHIDLLLPSFDEQQKIVAFLDTETTRIDNLIAKQEKLIELLEEQRKSIISHAVTKGLNPNAPMKESGVEWLGEVPEHWKIGKLKRWFNTVSGGTPNSNNYAKYYKNGTHPWLRTTDLNNGILTSFEIGITDEAIKESSCKYVPEDSVLIAMYGGDGTIGKNALLKFKSTINQAICALIPNSHFNPEYTFFYIQFYRPYWMVNAMGGRKDPNINQQQIQDAYFVLPPFDEQNKIVDFLKKEHSRIDSLVLKQNQLIEKMKEYRSSIISHAVTGKINVREWVA
ncbi:restriction endonuclease subunit S [Acinetobacter johnsonii]|uniref:restriction endonuclease subunit S n=1 Tax=Acinetobacter johnsonii TaxID=40214 RepID=UPI00244B2771|nr:restriction endonuclease subunit S [Acinetobacter johnsonii]MDH1488501.1 restriction endonuclease subunit S [Acinetobacter johnsonii]MDH1614433.1 restriction endonuclease subunit S [Acinetobacter johnsonii]